MKITIISLKLDYFCSYYIEDGVCFLVLCEKGFSKRLAYSYLEDLQTEFSSQYGRKVQTVSRPYSLIEFGGPGIALNVE